MILKKGLLLLLSMAAVKAQVIDDCAPRNGSSTNTTHNSDATTMCPVLDPPSDQTNSTNSTNEPTLLSILNSTNSPVPHFMTLLNSSSEFQPVIDLLSSPGNHTLFIPCDEALAVLHPSFNQTGNNTQGGNQTSSMNNTHVTHKMVVNPLFANLLSSFNLQKDESNAASNKTKNNATSSSVISQGVGNFSLVDVIKYHILNGSWPTDAISNGTHINDTLMSNHTAYPLATYVPVVIINNNTNGNASYGGTPNTTVTATNTTIGNNATNSNITIGNGIGYASFIVADIMANNGIIHIIDKVLVPPVSTVNTIHQLNESKVDALLNKSSNLTNILNSVNNVTIFLPSDAALNAMSKNKTHENESMEENPSTTNLENLAKSYIVNGTYTTTKVNSTMNVTTLGGDTIELQPTGNLTAFKVDNATITRSNILTNSGVIHIIDQVLPQNATSSPSPSSPSSTGGTKPTNQTSGSVSLTWRSSSVMTIFLIYLTHLCI
ncbi:uncharacterized protein BX664DRAFT_355189 [Halteromyces radiatus]|uniref:uncharacterized protein n=1 Tax=Halteromyces radiatus TaxID=101107 RepID=UPI00222000B2|nr:uncharacterized protein BX664DRAFT_355189 [Halteromyces radiatus]KAI8099802.1 hypothetical protein BX664DRAFT_355189 [Halteromyces radiatus]